MMVGYLTRNREKSARAERLKSKKFQSSKKASRKGKGFD